MIKGVNKEGNMSSRSYTMEFKKQAVELAENLGSAAKAAEQLGISDKNIQRWKREWIGSPTGMGKLEAGSVDSDELKRLRKENAELKQVNLILKTAAAFFSQDHLKKNTS
jgi:transposase